MRSGRQLLLAIIFLSIFSSLHGQDKNWSLRGYVKDLASFNLTDSAIYGDNLVHNRLNFRWFPNETFSARVELRTRLFSGYTVNNLSNYSSFIDQNDDYFDLSVIPIDRSNMVLHTMLDRASVSWKKNDWQLTVGRQRINWGINLAWNPNDIFNAYSFVDFDYEERPGSDAIRFQKFKGYAGGYEIAVKMTDDISNITAAGLYKWNISNYDLQIVGGLMKGLPVLGGGWAGSINLFGFKGEFTTIFKDDFLASEMVGSLSLDYAFPSSLYLNAGFLYNSASNSANLFQASTANLDIRSLSPYEYSTFFQASYPFHPLINGGFSTIYFPTDSSVLLNPFLTYSIVNNLDVDAVGQIFLSKTDSPTFAFVRLKFSF